MKRTPKYVNGMAETVESHMNAYKNLGGLSRHFGEEIAVLLREYAELLRTTTPASEYQGIEETEG